MQVWWNRESGIESFNIIYETEYEAHTWYSQLDERRKIEHQKVLTNQEEQIEWRWGSGDTKGTLSALDNPYSDSDCEEEVESELEKHPEFHVTPTREHETDSPPPMYRDRE